MGIYTITVIHDILDNGADCFPTTIHEHCIGFFHTLEDAQAAVLSNLGDMHEFHYQYAVIEHVHEGLYQTDINPEFYTWNKSTNAYELLPKENWPHNLDMICGFGIG